jgi:hypothetical protein
MRFANVRKRVRIRNGVMVIVPRCLALTTLTRLDRMTEPLRYEIHLLREEIVSLRLELDKAHREIEMVKVDNDVLSDALASANLIAKAANGKTPTFTGTMYELWEWLGELPAGADSVRVIVYGDQEGTT